MTFVWNDEHSKALAYAQAQELATIKPDDFWAAEAKNIHWSKEFTKVHDGRFAFGEWFIGGELNVSYNCLDRHILLGNGEKTAIIFEDEAGQQRKLSYQELLTLTNHVATMLDQRCIKPGDRVAIYMPMIPEAVATMLACTRVGAVHTVVFGGFAKEALIDRIHDAEAKAVITASQTQRKGNLLQLKEVVLDALKDARCQSVTTVICFGLEQKDANQRLIPFMPQPSWPEHIKNPKAFSAQHPLFILYTSGTTGKPKGIFHATGGYLVQAVATARWVFDFKPMDRYWCSADVGWITGHSYIAYAPLALGATIFMYDGALNWPDMSRVYKLIEQHKISIFYTAPTAIRMFMRAGDKVRQAFDLSSLRLLGSVGEPINPQAWLWYSRVFGQEHCPIIDTWWQTETGAMMITPIPGITKPKPGSATKPFFAIRAEVVDDHGQTTAQGQSGYLVITQPWPSLARGIWGDNDRFLDTYFKKMPGYYFTGDGAKVDDDGDFIISGRIDDVVNVSGHRLGTAEIESALVSHESVAEAAVVGVPDELTGQSLHAFVLLMHGAHPSEHLDEELKNHVKNIIGSFAKPQKIYFERVLPKTRSGKIMRRLLRAKATGEAITADISTLDEATV